jgi:argininosuccinate lyase
MAKGKKEKKAASAASQAEGVLGLKGRLGAQPAAELVAGAFARELAEQEPLFEGLGLADLAHAVALIETGAIPREAGAKLLSALLELHERPPGFVPDPALGDLYTNREAWLRANTEAAGWLGMGRARREATTLAFLLHLRARILDLAEALGEAASALLDTAAEHRRSLMPDYTYLQAAQPTTFGHYLLGFLYPLLRDLDRLRALYSRVNRSPAGCGSVNGSRLPMDRRRLAELLGFDDLVRHARDAMWRADETIEAAACATCALVDLDRLAEDLQIFATGEFGFIELADCHARASVIQPQKKNPYPLAYVRGAAGEAIGALAAVAVEQRTPSGSVDNRIFAYGSLPRLYETAAGAARLMAGVIRKMRFDGEAAHRRLDAGFAGATDLADVLVEETRLDPRTAHRIVARLVRQAIAAGRTAADLGPADLAAAAKTATGATVLLSERSFRQALDPRAAIAARGNEGGAAAKPMAAMLRESRAKIAAALAWRDKMAVHNRKAETVLLRRARSLRR